MLVHRIPSTFAAIVTGADLSQALDPAATEAIDRAIAKHGVVIFRDQTLTDETQAAFARRFGELEQSAKIYRSGNRHRIQSGAIIDVSNLDEHSAVRGRDDRRRLESISNMIWHADASFRPVVGALSMLYAHAVPPRGGETEFADLRAAYEAMSEEMKVLTEDLVAEHVYGHARTQLGFPSHSEEERQALPPVRHPLVRLHRGSGRKSLYIGSHAAHIVGWPVPEGRMLLLDLLEHATQREFVYRHHWRVGDLVIWDNRCTLHRGRRFDESFPRDLRRVTTRDAPAPGPRPTS